MDAHLKDLVTSGKRKLNCLLRILCNPSLSLYLRWQVILSILRPSLEYGNEVWRYTSTQSKALDAVLLGACKKILSCSSKTCNEAVWVDLGVEPLAIKRAKSKVVWYFTLLGKDKNSYCRQIFDKKWGKCKLQGRRRKQWKKCVMDIISDMSFKQLRQETHGQWQKCYGEASVSIYYYYYRKLKTYIYIPFLSEIYHAERWHKDIPAISTVVNSLTVFLNDFITFEQSLTGVTLAKVIRFFKKVIM